MADSRGYAFEGSEPEIDPTARVSREATLVGDVSVAADASVRPGVVLRGTPASVVPLSETDIDPDAVFDEYHSGEYTDLAQRHGALFE